MSRRQCRFAILVDDHISHFHALAGVARRLVHAGHEVCFYCPGKWADQIVAAGFSCVVEPFLSPLAGSSGQGRKAARLALRSRAAEISREASRFAQDYRPDLLIFDPFLLCHWPAFRKAGLKAVAVSTKPLLTTDALVPPYTSAVIPSRGWSGRALVCWATFYQQLKYARYRLECSMAAVMRGRSHRSLTLAVARYAGLNLKAEWQTRPVPYDLRFAAVPELVLHAKELDFPRIRPLSGPGCFLGPCADLPGMDGTAPLPLGNGPLVFANLGTVSAQRRRHTLAAYTALLDAIAMIPGCRAVIATADAAITTVLRQHAHSCTNRIRIATWVPRGQYPVLADLVVTHGGSNSVKEAVLAGKPMLLMPHSADQPGMAARAVFHGLGRMCRKPQAGLLKMHLLELLANTDYAARVAAMRNAFLEYDRRHVCVRVLENAAAGIIPRFTINY